MEQAPAGDGAPRIGERVDSMEVRWADRRDGVISHVEVDRLIHIREGEGIVRTDEFGAAKRSATESWLS